MQQLREQDITIKIARPVKKAKLTQSFGKPYNDFYAQKYREFGLIVSDMTSPLFGQSFHQGIDFGTAQGQECFAAFPGQVTAVVNNNPTAGNYVKYITDHLRTKDRQLYYLEFRYFHLESSKLKVGDRLDMGSLVGVCDSTGFSSGPHLHFDVAAYAWNQVEATRGYFQKCVNNGYLGFINPELLFVSATWDKLPVDEQYGKKRNWILEYTFRFANAPFGAALTPFLSERVKAGRFVHKQLLNRGRKPPALTNRETNALIYGSWDLDTVLDPARFSTWGWYTKSEVTEAEIERRKLSTPLTIG